MLWTDLDLVQGRIRVRQQWLTGGAEPTFVPVKGKQARSVDIAPEAIELLKTHKSAQAALKMRNRLQYHDHGLVFAKEWSDVGRKHDVLGDPLQANNLGQREFAHLIKNARVRRIKFHDLRHTSATPLLAAEVPSKVVQERLGHKKIGTTFDVYALVVPSMQRDAARRLAARLPRC